MARRDNVSGSDSHSHDPQTQDGKSPDSAVWPADDNGFAEVFIREKARQLVAKVRASNIDQDEIEQKLRIKLWRNQKSFDPQKGDWQAFAKTVVIRCAATILRDRRAQRRNPARIGSLNVSITNRAGRSAELATTISESAGHPSFRHHEDLVDLQLDVSEALGDLDDEDRELCESLMLDSASEAARERRVPRTTLNDAIHKLREPLENAGLRIHLT